MPINLSVLILLCLCCGVCVSSVLWAATPAFTEFDQRARHGERLTVVFFGASLTWGANASDQDTTSYRAVFAAKLNRAYPKAHFTFYDAAIGGTGSQLGVFRLDRDVLRHQPDLVLLDFSANDDIDSDTPETLSSYESLVRRIVRDGHCPVLPIIFPFKWNIEKGELVTMKRRTAHLAIASAYHTIAGDAIASCLDAVNTHHTTLAAIWPYDGVHPGDTGYCLFAEAAWRAYQSAVAHHLVCRVPEQMLYPDTYMQLNRARIAKLGALPAGWQVEHPSLTAAWHDAQMSRWLDEVVVASNRQPHADNGDHLVAERLRIQFTGSMVMLYGEKTMDSGKYRAFLDGKQLSPPGGKAPGDFDASALPFGGNIQLGEVLATGLDARVPHTLEIEPVFAGDHARELRLESICVAGGTAEVHLLTP